MLRDQIGEPTRRDRLGFDAELLADPPHDPVHLAREPVDEPGLERGDRRLPDHGRWRREVDLHEPRRPGEEGVHRDLDPGGEHAADELPLPVLPRRGEDVEVGAGAEVDDDARSAVARVGGDGVDDPVGPHFARVVVANRDARLHSRARGEQGRLRPALRDPLPLALERGHGGREADPVDVLEVEGRGERDAELVAGAAAIGGEPEAVGELVAPKEAEHRLRVADVDGQEHRPSVPRHTRRGQSLAVPGAPLAVRRPVEQYGGTGRRLERRERREAAPEAGSAGREARPPRGR